ncbi:GntR family transcriptional regulator [Kordiimonas pumila]|uniref:GntR family transcriptional regulator n=1 Tax=Kordiimonas pumila TaxID=2161677 RepID=A0ABV7DAB6_9PROT|nr:GntR family transcriptional regulator [Kordiimonas pumila]
MTLTSKIYDDLSEAILAGQFRPDEKLKAEHIKARFGVSAATVREALNRLLADGLVLVHDRRGFTVAPFSPSDLADIIRSRLLIEVECVADSIKHGDDTWEMNLVAAYHRLGKAEAKADLGDDDSLKAQESANRHFHDCLVSACQSPTLLGFYRNLFARHYRYRRFALRNKIIVSQAAVDHKNLLEAALERDIDKARSIINDHIMRTQVHAEALLEDFENQLK